MKPEDSQDTNSPQINQSDSLASVNDQGSYAVKGQHNSNKFDDPRNGNKSHKKSIAITILLLVALLIAFVIVGRIYNQSGSNNISKLSSLKKIEGGYELQFFGNTIPQVSCSGVSSLAKDEDLLRSSENRYVCFGGDLSVEGEVIKYAKIQLSPEFEKEWEESCSVDCGFSPTDYPEEQNNVGEFIVRANGKIENYKGFGGGGLDSLLNDITGCGTGSHFGITDKLKDGTLVIDSDKIGSLSAFSNLEVKDSFGNLCTIDLSLVSYLTTTGPWELTSSVRITNVALVSKFNDASSCKNETAPSAVRSCYIAHAALRGDLSLCDSLTSPTPKLSPNSGFDDCVTAVAKRKKDPEICDKIRYYREQFVTTCKNDTNKLRAAFDGEVVVR